MTHSDYYAWGFISNPRGNGSEGWRKKFYLK